MSGRRRWLNTTAMLMGMTIGLALLLAACSSRVDEAASGTVVGKIKESQLGSGKSASATFDLSPGGYVLICNIPGHYDAGMYTAFQVNGEDGPKSATVGIVLGEWFVRADSASVTADSVTFQVTNKGKDGHELVVVKTDLAADALVLN